MIRTMVKMFYYRVRTTSTRKAGGRLQTAEVFRVLRGKIVKIGETKWNTAGYKGPESEVFGFLRGKNLVSAAAYNSKGGYYTWAVGEKYKFKIESM